MKSCLHSASQIGRATNERRTRTIEEVKRLELLSKLKKDGTLMNMTEYERGMDDIVKTLTGIQLDLKPNTAESFALMLDREQEYLVVIHIPGSC